MRRLANEENLIPVNKRPKSEQREIRRKGGIASGKARRKKANLKKAMEIILASDVDDKKIKKELDKMGFENTNEMVLALAMFKKASNGNVRAFEQIIRLTNGKDEHDIAEQKERIKALKIKNEQTKNDLASSSDSGVVIVDAWSKDDDNTI